MVRETWRCTKCGNEIYLLVKWNFKKNPISKKCECGGLWKFKPVVIKRRNMDIWNDIQKMIGINTENYEECIHYANFTNKELLKLEKAIQSKIKFLNKKKKR